MQDTGKQKMSLNKLSLLFAVCLATANLSVPAAEKDAAVAVTAPAPVVTAPQQTVAPDRLEKLIKILVEQHVLSESQGREILQHLEKESHQQSSGVPNEKSGEQLIRIPYVPDIVLDKIKQQVRTDLGHEVVEDVIQHAKTERWGIPAALPDWISMVKFKGDFRLRGQGDFFADGNIKAPPTGYVDFMKVNDAGGFGKTDNPFFNTSKNRERMRVRVRLAMEARPTANVKVGLRLSTGNDRDPVSTNQTLGNTGNRYQTLWDRAYLQYDNLDADGYPRLTLWGGRLPSPWFSTNLVWDSDLGFEGVAARYRYRLTRSSSPREITGQQSNLFLTLGAFPLQEVALSSRDKWLFGAQLGSEWIMQNRSTFKVGLAYYDFENIRGQRNSQDSTLLDYTAPEFMQKGNLLFDIRNDTDPSTQLWALAADYKIVNLTARYDFANLAPIHVLLTADYTKNIGYDASEIRDRTGGAVARSQGYRAGTDPIRGRTEGYQLEVAVGWPSVLVRGNWRISGTYRHLERDAVLDAFTDSDFFLGGTDTEGWIVSAYYGIKANIWLQARLLSADEIDGAPMGVDVVQIDINAKF